ncbi:MAG: TetR family transcriptional regulator C-terminal domain-containing protein, partial [Pyrinomonadaceae bacterium]
GRCPKTADKARRNLAAAEKALHRALVRGRESGEIKNGRDPRAVARFLYSSLQGLQVMAKATQDRKLLGDVVRVTLSVLD